MVTWMHYSINFSFRKGMLLGCLINLILRFPNRKKISIILSKYDIWLIASSLREVILYLADPNVKNQLEMHIKSKARYTLRDVTLAAWCRNSPATWMFVQTDTTGNIKAPRYWPYAMGFQRSNPGCGDGVVPVRTEKRVKIVGGFGHPLSKHST